MNNSLNYLNGIVEIEKDRKRYGKDRFQILTEMGVDLIESGKNFESIKEE